MKNIKVTFNKSKISPLMKELIKYSGKAVCYFEDREGNTYGPLKCKTKYVKQ